MFDAVVEINDINLPIWQDDDCHECPAFALLDSNSLSFGAAARDQARLYPLRINNRFIQQLSLVETPNLNPHARHHADLAYRFLQFAHQKSRQPDRCVFVIPPSYTEENMAVLLGVVKQCQFDAVGLVDQAVAVASQASVESGGVYCDLQLHQLVLGSYRNDNGEIVRGPSQTVEQYGMLQLSERWVRIISQAFIKQCRFDPLHDASTEQQLWVQLPKILAEHHDKEVFSISLLNKHLVEIPRAAMLEPVDELYAQIQKRLSSQDADAKELLCSARLAALPGLLAKDPKFRAVDADAAAIAVAECQTHICSNTSNLPFVSKLPAKMRKDVNTDRRTAASQSPVVADAGATTVTHFVVDGIAYPLAEAKLHLSSLGDAIVWSQKEGTVAAAVVVSENDQWLVRRTAQSEMWHNNVRSKDGAVALNKGDRIKFSEQGAEICFIRLSA